MPTWVHYHIKHLMLHKMNGKKQPYITQFFRFYHIWSDVLYKPYISCMHNQEYFRHTYYLWVVLVSVFYVSVLFWYYTWCINLDTTWKIIHYNYIRHYCTISKYTGCTHRDTTYCIRHCSNIDITQGVLTLIPHGK